MMATIDNYIEDIREKTVRTPKETKILFEYDTLIAEMDSCHELYIGVNKNSAGDEFNEYSMGICKAKGGATELDPSGMVTCSMKNFEASSSIVSENLYRKSNCIARPIFRKALRLIIRVGYIEPKEPSYIKGNGIDLNKAGTYQNKMSQQLKV
jgi:hypothetical protein